jgi:hypothetical protein
MEQAVRRIRTERLTQIPRESAEVAGGWNVSLWEAVSSGEGEGGEGRGGGRGDRIGSDAESSGWPDPSGGCESCSGAVSRILSPEKPGCERVGIREIGGESLRLATQFGLL